MQPTSNNTMEPFERLMDKAKPNADWRRQQEEIADTARLIDKLSGEMGSSNFRDAMRLHGYDIDACLMTLGRRREYQQLRLTFHMKNELTALEKKLLKAAKEAYAHLKGGDLPEHESDVNRMLRLAIAAAEKQTTNK